MIGFGLFDLLECYWNFFGSLELRKFNFVYRNWIDFDFGNIMFRESRGEVVDFVFRFGVERVDCSEVF